MKKLWKEKFRKLKWLKCFNVRKITGNPPWRQGMYRCNLRGQGLHLKGYAPLKPWNPLSTSLGSEGCFPLRCFPWLCLLHRCIPSLIFSSMSNFLPFLIEAWFKITCRSNCKLVYHYLSECMNHYFPPRIVFFSSSINYIFSSCLPLPRNLYSLGCIEKSFFSISYLPMFQKCAIGFGWTNAKNEIQIRGPEPYLKWPWR